MQITYLHLRGDGNCSDNTSTLIQVSDTYSIISSRTTIESIMDAQFKQ